VTKKQNVAEQATAAMQLDKAVKMRVKGAHWNEIAAACGYATPAAALQAVGEAMAAATSRATATVDQYRDEAELRLGSLLKSTLDMLDESAPYDEDGNQPDDRAVRLRAVDEARRIVADLGKLQGLEKPVADTPDENHGIRIIGVAVEDIV
jgi:hypothetical protein